MGLIEKKPEELYNKEIKHIFFSNSGCCNQKSEQFLSRTSNLSNEKQELFSQRGKLLLAPQRLNPKPHEYESKNFHDAMVSAESN